MEKEKKKIGCAKSEPLSLSLHVLWGWQCFIFIVLELLFFTWLNNMFCSSKSFLLQSTGEKKAWNVSPPSNLFSQYGSYR